MDTAPDEDYDNALWRAVQARYGTQAPAQPANALGASTAPAGYYAAPSSAYQSPQDFATANTGLGDQVRNRLQQYIGGFQAMQPKTAGDLGEMALYSVPGLGQGLSIKDAAQAGSSGDWPGVGIALGGMFGGPLAKTADHAALARAGEMHAAGHSATDIWHSTGWFQGADNKWRFEIPDNAATLSREGQTFEPQWRSYADPNDEYPQVRDLMQHDALTAAYPHVMMKDVKLLPKSETAAGWLDRGDISVNRNLPRSEVSPTLLHEMQHGIQEHEGFPYGAGLYQDVPDDAYHRLAGEVESRNVETRMNMTPEQRLASPPWTTQDVPNDQQIVRFGGNGPAMSAGENKLQPYITAYHGSPHDFDQFDLSKIGTGEGAQAYGHGLYFAESPGVAQSYRDALAPPTGQTSPHYGMLWDMTEKELLNRGYSPGHVREALNELKGEHGAGGSLANVNPEAFPPEYAPIVRDALELGGKTLDQARGVSPGRMYEVNINADPEHFLDWDKPLSEQSPQVRQALQPHVNALKDRMVSDASSWGKSTPEDLSAYSKQADEVINRMRGNQIWQSAEVAASKDEKGRMVRLSNEVGPLASQNLNQGGIPGIKYFDGGSRAAGEGSRNYVVFDDKLISIVKKYGIPGAIGLGLISPEIGRQMQEQGI